MMMIFAVQNIIQISLHVLGWATGFIYNGIMGYSVG
jgi:hypothetical protein